jgi:hypothetical protein
MHTGVQTQIGPYRMMFGLFNNNSTGVARGTATCLPFCKNISLPQVFSRDRAAQLSVFFVFFVKHCLLVLFLWSLCCLSFNYGFQLSLWYLQTFRETIYYNTHKNGCCDNARTKIKRDISLQTRFKNLD